MKKFTKGMLIAAGIFGAVGIGLTAAGGVMGASMSELTGVKSLKRVLLVADGDYDYDDDDDYDDSGKNVTVKESSDTLKVKSTKKLSKNRKVCISYPEDVKLQELEIEMGAGTVYLNRDIETEKLSVEMGAGEFESKNPVTAREADLEIGTGSMTFADLSARKTDGECGLGELDLTLTGTQEDYNYDLECGVGNLDVGSDSYSGLGREKTISNKGADRKLDLECGMGNISVDFSGKEHRDLQIS